MGIGCSGRVSGKGFRFSNVIFPGKGCEYASMRGSIHEEREIISNITKLSQMPITLISGHDYVLLLLFLFFFFF